MSKRVYNMADPWDAGLMFFFGFMAGLFGALLIVLLATA